VPSVMSQRPRPGEYNPHFERYVARVPETDILAVLERQAEDVRSALAAVSEERGAFRYEPGKWSIREVLGHVIDAERVFGYRALCIARGDSTPLPGFEENDYAANAGADRASVASLVEEFRTLRRSNLLLLKRLDEAAWPRLGTANGHPTSARALAFIMAGHVRHHLAVLQARYGVQSA